MSGGGSSELRALLVQVRQLDSRLTACERDLIKLGRQVALLCEARDMDVSAEAADRISEAAFNAVAAAATARGAKVRRGGK